MNFRLLISLFLFSCLAEVSYASEDIEYIKEKILRPFYYGDSRDPGVVKKAEDYSKNSFSAADSHLETQFNSLVKYMDAEINKTAKDVEPTFRKAKDCLDELEQIKAIFAPYMDEEATFATRAEVERYRRSYLTVDNFNIFTDAVLRVQSIHHDCYPYVLAVRDLNEDFSTFANGLNFSLCNLFDVVTYESLGLIKDIPLRPEYKIDNDFKWPDLEVNYVTSTTCPKPSASDSPPLDRNPSCVNGVFVSTRGTPYTSKYMQTRENVRFASAVSAVALSQCGPCLTYMQQSIPFMSGPTSAMVIPAVSAFVIEMAISYIEQEERKREIERLENFIDTAESKIETAFATAITEREFNEKRANFCRANQERFEESIEQSVMKIKANDHLAQIRNYFTNNDRIVDWYNDVFLFATSGPAGNRLIDDAAKAAVLRKRDQLYSSLERIKAEVYFTRSNSQLRSIQSKIGISCLQGATRSEKMRNFKSAVAEFRSECESLSSLSSASSDYLLDARGDKTDIRCHYLGFEPADNLSVRANVDGSLDINVLSGDRVVLAVERASSNTIWEKEFYCSSDSLADFGTPSAKPISTQSQSLSYPVDVNGLSPSDFSKFKQNVKSINDTAKTAASSCARLLRATPSQQPANFCIQGI